MEKPITREQIEHQMHQINSQAVMLILFGYRQTLLGFGKEHAVRFLFLVL